MPVYGAREVAKSLKQLALEIDVPMNRTSRYALRPALNAARRNARSASFDESIGLLAKSLTIKRDKRRSRRLFGVHQVGPSAGVSGMTQSTRTGKPVKRRPVAYAHLVEFGTAGPYAQPKLGSVHPGSRPKPFLTPAYFETRYDVEKRFKKMIGSEIEARARRLASKPLKSRRIPT